MAGKTTLLTGRTDSSGSDGISFRSGVISRLTKDAPPPVKL